MKFCRGVSEVHRQGRGKRPGHDPSFYLFSVSSHELIKLSGVRGISVSSCSNTEAKGFEKLFYL